MAVQREAVNETTAYREFIKHVLHNPDRDAAERDKAEAHRVIDEETAHGELSLVYRCATEHGSNFDVMYEDEENFYLVYGDASPQFLVYGPKGLPGPNGYMQGWFRVKLSDGGVRPVECDPWSCPPKVQFSKDRL